ncbi:MAG TPA: Holliday junction resolvase RuvX [Candidatus Saccharimonadales bacterium]|nr:Holliday junction resolvase RuvX [Candidatus Saccharimonadales bacterium]
MPITPRNFLALDVGEKRVGVAIASLAARLPRPLTTLHQGNTFWDELQQIIGTENIDEIVVGLPRGLEGQSTSQTTATESFVRELRSEVNLPVHLQDEALTSIQAETELQSRGALPAKADIDALAATYILEDFLASYNRTSATETT